MKYYWIDTDAGFYRGESAFALHQMDVDKDGNKDVDTDEVILSMAYEDLDGYSDAVSEYYDDIAGETYKEVDTDLVWEMIDKYIMNELGFVPDYDVN